MWVAIGMTALRKSGASRTSSIALRASAGGLVVSQCVDGVQLGGFPGGVVAEEDADHRRESEGQSDGATRDDGGPTGDLWQREGDPEAQCNTDQSAHH